MPVAPNADLETMWKNKKCHSVAASSRQQIAAQLILRQVTAELEKMGNSANEGRYRPSIPYMDSCDSDSSLWTQYDIHMLFLVHVQ